MAKGDRKNLKQLVGICGIYCGTCPMYLAPQYHGIEYLKESSKKTGLPVEEIRCGGCLSDQLYSSCKECRHGFRECANEKHVTWCFQCHDFPCHRLHSFLNIHIVEGISHHAKLIEELQYMREHGIEDWLEKQDRASRCSKCGKVLYWFDRKCPDCQIPVQRVFS
jgi:hypothetical protein